MSGKCRFPVLLGEGKECDRDELILAGLIILSIEKETEEVKSTSDVYSQPPYQLINRVVGCVTCTLYTS